MLALPLRGSTPDLYHGKYVAGMFGSGEQGVWYDPSDFSTMFQDAAGTTPVTAVEQPVGLMLDKSKGLVLGSELVNVPFGGSAGGAFAIAATSVTRNGSTGVAMVNLSAATTAGRFAKVSFTVSNQTGDGTIVRIGGGAYYTIVANGTYAVLIPTGTSSTALTFAPYFGSAGTINIDNISVRELHGNHAYQSTSASRPVLSARVNLLTYTEQFDNAAWTKTKAGVGVVPVVTANAGTAPDGTLTADRVQFDCGGTTISDRSTLVTPVVSIASGVEYIGSVWVKAYSSGDVGKQVRIFGDSVLTASIVTLTSDWQRITTVGNAKNTIGNFGIETRGAYTTNVTADVLIWGADLRPTNSGINLPPYQRVGASTDYDTAGFPHYLKFDGIDDSLVTNSIDFTATDKMTVLAGVRKLSDAAQAVVVELSASAGGYTGTFLIDGPHAVPGPIYRFGTHGSSFFASAVSPAAYPAPTTNVITGLGNISGDSAILRINGAQVAADKATDQGTGNYGNYPLYIGRRNGASLPFKGHLYGLIVRGAQTDDLHLTNAEKFLAYKSGVTL